MGKNNIQFWYHPIFGGTGIQNLLEHYYPNSFKLYTDESVIDSSVKNIITFFWETSSAINLKSKSDKDEFYELISELSKLGFCFLADYTTEANYGIDSDRIIFLDKLKSVLGNLDTFILVSNNSSDVDYIQYGHHKIKSLLFPHFLLSTPIEMKKYVGEFETNHKVKDFLCLNRRMQQHKFDFMEGLWKRKLLDNTYWTWVTSYITNPNIEMISDIGVDLDNFHPIQLDGDIMYGIELDRADEYLYTINPKWYFQSKVNLVTETNAYDAPIHLTEKTFKPIFLEIPFVVFGSNGHLNTLKEYGFNTFESLIGEYDTTSVESVIVAGLKLLEIWDTADVIDICKSNRKILLNDETHRRIINTYFLNKI
jgi:hypothetical protein